MMEIKGKVNTAYCFAKVIEDEAIEQIRRMCDYEFPAGDRIRIMPDVHAFPSGGIIKYSATGTPTVSTIQPKH